jgi:site-specific recombinase XerC
MLDCAARIQEVLPEAVWQRCYVHFLRNALDYLPRKAEGKRDQAILAVLLGCGLRRRELAQLQISHLQRCEEHWAMVDLIGKGGHIRTVPIPEWVKDVLDRWLSAADSFDVCAVLANGGAMASLKRWFGMW